MNTYLRFGLVSTAVTAALLALGALLTRDASSAAREAMIWALAVVYLGALVGAIPLVLGPAREVSGEGSIGPAAVSRFLAAMILRMGAVGVGAAGVIFLAALDVRSFLLWLAAGYLVFLVVETAFALRVFRRL